MADDARRPAMKRPGSELAIVAAGNVLALIGLFVTLKILANVLSLEEFGRYGLALALAGGISRLLFSPLSQAALRFTAAAREAGDAKLLGAMLGERFRQMCVAAAILTVPAMLAVPGLDPAIALPGAAVAMLLGLNVIVSSQLAALRARKIVAAGQVFTAFGRGILGLIAILAAGLQAGGALAGYCVALCLTNAVQLARLARYGLVSPKQFLLGPRSGTDNPYRLRVSGYVTAFVWITALELVVLEFDKLFFAHFLSLGEIGLLVAMQQVAKAPTILLAGLAEQYFYPVFFEDKNKTDAASVSRLEIRASLIVFMATVLPLLAASMAIAWIAPAVAGLLLADGYVAGSAMLPLLMAGYSISLAGRLLQLPGLAALEVQPFALAKLAQAVTLFALFVIWVPVHGVMAAAMAFAASSVMFLAIMAAVNIRLYLRAT